MEIEFTVSEIPNCTDPKSISNKTKLEIIADISFKLGQTYQMEYPLVDWENFKVQNKLWFDRIQEIMNEVLIDGKSH